MTKWRDWSGENYYQEGKIRCRTFCVTKCAKTWVQCRALLFQWQLQKLHRYNQQWQMNFFSHFTATFCTQGSILNSEENYSMKLLCLFCPSVKYPSVRSPPTSLAKQYCIQLQIFTELFLTHLSRSDVLFSNINGAKQAKSLKF